MMWIGGKKGPTLDRNTRGQVEDDKKALIQVWEQREKEINAVLISVRRRFAIHRGLSRVNDHLLFCS
jgi:hypothetical protein